MLDQQHADRRQLGNLMTPEPAIRSAVILAELAPTTPASVRVSARRSHRPDPPARALDPHPDAPPARVDYAVVLVVRDREIEHTVRVYDGAHGVNELHRYTRSGGKQPAEVFHGGTLADGMRDAIRQVASGYEAMIESWRRSLKSTRAISPSQGALDAAIERAIERAIETDRLLYPDRAMFVDADEPLLGDVIRRATDDGRVVVIAYGDGTTRVVHATKQRASSRPRAAVGADPAERPPPAHRETAGGSAARRVLT